MIKNGNGNGWIGKALAVLFLGSIISYLGWAGIEIISAKEHYSLKINCESRERRLQHNIECAKDDEAAHIKEIKESIAELRAENKDLLKAVYRSLNRRDLE